jgi:hypothetical protein
MEGSLTVSAHVGSDVRQTAVRTAEPVVRGRSTSEVEVNVQNVRLHVLTVASFKMIAF